MEDNKKCCAEPVKTDKKSFLAGIVHGLIPHSFCLAFALFSVIGAVTVSAFLKKVLLIPNIFLYLILVSLILATLSIYIYLKKTGCLCRGGLKNSWRYIFIVYLVTVSVNLIFFYSIIPALANLGSGRITSSQETSAGVDLKVLIPCTGHSFLIMDEIKKVAGVTDVKFTAPDVFRVKYNAQTTSVNEITSLKIFETFKITVL